VYDFELIQDYKNELQNFAREYESMKAIQYISDNIDCSEVEFFDDELFRRGIITWYTPAKLEGKHTPTAIQDGGVSRCLQINGKLVLPCPIPIKSAAI